MSAKFSIKPVYKKNIKDTSNMNSKILESIINPNPNPDPNTDIHIEQNEPAVVAAAGANNKVATAVKDTKEDYEKLKRQVSLGYPARANLLRGYRGGNAINGFGIKQTASGVIDLL